MSGIPSGAVFSYPPGLSPFYAMQPLHLQAHPSLQGLQGVTGGVSQGQGIPISPMSQSIPVSSLSQGIPVTQALLQSMPQGIPPQYHLMPRLEQVPLLFYFLQLHNHIILYNNPIEYNQIYWLIGVKAHSNKIG
jgi:hypothetical protein